VTISSTFYSSFLCQYLFAKKLQSQIVTREKLSEALLYEKFARKIDEIDYSSPFRQNFMISFLLKSTFMCSFCVLTVCDCIFLPKGK